MADEVAIDVGDAKQMISSMSELGKVSVQQMLEAIKALEKEEATLDGISNLHGKWRLVWTSGTKKYQEFNKALNAPIKPMSSNIKVIQSFDVASSWIENEVYFPFGSLVVAGSFEYTKNRRIQFTFNQARIKLGILPTISLPLGKWATGWLLSTYLDETRHIERGNQGGISVYLRES